LEVVAQVLAGLYAERTWPQSLPASDASQLFPIAALRAFSAAVPTDSDVAVGDLHFTAAPTVSAVSGATNVILHQPFRLDIVGRPPEPVVSIIGQTPAPHVLTSLVGTLSLGIGLAAKRVDDKLQITIGGITTPTPAESVHLDIDASSPIQPRDGQALAN